MAPHFLAVINLSERFPKDWYAPGMNECCARGSRMRNSSGSRIRNVGSPTICRSSNASRTNRGWEVTDDKVERMRAIARWLSEQWFNRGLMQAHVADADRAAELSKCDLATEMVREFTELQGIVGGLYARAQGEPDDVADAIYDHYRPVGLDDPIPRNLTGCAVALGGQAGFARRVLCGGFGSNRIERSVCFAARRLRG